MNKTLNEIKNILKSANVEEAEVKAKIILRNGANFSDSDLILDKVPKNAQNLFEIAKKHAQTGEPIQYLLNVADFMGEKFKVTKDVLIPRDETELLVNLAIEKIDESKLTTILDIGTGSGCIPCMIAKKVENVEILGVDISSSALMVALENVQKFDLIKKVVFRKSDIFSALRENEKFDLIISNPPYIPHSLKSSLSDTVKNFEPHLALFADNDGLDFYKKIILGAKNYLNKGGFVMFECGVFKNGQSQAQKIAQMFEEEGFCEIEIKKDLAGIERNVCARFL